MGQEVAAIRCEQYRQRRDTIAAPTYAPNDSLFGPVIQALADVVKAQIPAISQIYLYPQDGEYEDNSVVFTYEWEVEDDTNGKLRLRIILSVNHLFNRNQVDDVYPVMQSYIMPWLLVTSAWRNQALFDANGNQLSMSLTPGKGKPQPLTLNGIPYLALVYRLVVTTEFNVDTTE